MGVNDDVMRGRQVHEILHFIGQKQRSSEGVVDSRHCRTIGLGEQIGQGEGLDYGLWEQIESLGDKPGKGLGMM